MDGKTKIWRGGLSGLTGGAPRGPSTLRGVGAPMPGPIHIGPTPPGPAPLELKPNLLQATRILPIERLLPGHIRASAFGAASTVVLARKRSPRVLGHVFISLLTLLAVAAWQLPPLLTVPALRPRKLARQAAAPAREPASAETRPKAASAAPLQATGHADVTRRAADKLQRAAVDALIAGDYAAAQRHYHELARSSPAQPVFLEAERILAAREHR